MGVVYKARQLTLERPVALKMILKGRLAGVEEVTRFRTEALAAARLQHPNIVQLYEVGEYDGLPFLALEYVDGPTLARRLSGAAVPDRPAAELVETLARAVAAAHERGIVHRDLKPGNVLLAPVGGTSGEPADPEWAFGVPKITDFGLAKLADHDPRATVVGQFLGTPAYVAPEQARGDRAEIGPATDIYALGAILYELLTGRPPFQGTTTVDVLAQQAFDGVVPPSQVRPGVHRDLEAICLRCLAKSPVDRYPRALALADDLRRFRNGEPTRARPPGRVERLGRWCKRYPVPATLLVAFTVCLVFGFWYLSRLTDDLVRSAALESAAQQSDLLREVNDSYTDVVRRAKAGNLEVTHDYAARPAAIPIPATFTIELGQSYTDRSDTGVQVRVYSDYPFRSRRNGGPRDDFERDALRRLRENPGEPVYRFEDYKGRPALRYTTPRLMQETCVACHNSHPDSTKTDWKVGDVRGVVEVIRPLDRDVARTRSGLWGAFAFVGIVCAALLGLACVLLLAGRARRHRS
jgi:serine/threonine protein kinase